MNLYIKQRVFSWGDKFSVYDENGNERFYVEGEVFSFGKKLHLYDLSGVELAYIEQEIFTFLPKYKVYRGDVEIAKVIREFTFFKQEYSIEGLGWQVHGDFFDHCYEVLDCGMSIANVTKEWFTWGDTYQISIADGVDAINALAVVLVIDACIDAENS